MFTRRISILAGHFGSGKSEIAVNYAMSLARSGVPVSLVDLDVVKPYFRSRSARDELARAGVELVAPSGDNYYADLPIIIPRVRGLCMDRSRRIILDLGGDDVGARVLGSLSDVVDPGQVETAAVVNFRRPLTPDPAAAVAMIRGIEGSARLRVDGVISNTHLMQDTTPEIVRAGYALAVETARMIGTKVMAVCVPSVIKDDFRADDFDCEIFPVSRVIRTTFAADTDRDSSTGDDVGGLSAGSGGASGRSLPGAYGVRKVGPLFVPAAMPDEEG